MTEEEPSRWESVAGVVDASQEGASCGWKSKDGLCATNKLCQSGLVSCHDTRVIRLVDCRLTIWCLMP